MRESAHPPVKKALENPKNYYRFNSHETSIYSGFPIFSYDFPIVSGGIFSKHIRHFSLSPWAEETLARIHTIESWRSRALMKHSSHRGTP